MRRTVLSLASLALATPFAAPAAAQVGRVVAEARYDVQIATGAAAPCPLAAALRFGHGLTPVGDLNGDGFEDLVVGAPGSSAGLCTGRLVTLFLGPDFSITSAVVDDLRPTRSNILTEFGLAVANLGDLDGNGTIELAITEHRGGGIRVAELHADGTLTGLSFHQAVVNAAFSARAVAGIGDINGDSVGDMALGIPGVSVDPCLFFGPFAGAVRIEFLATDGLPIGSQQIGASAGGFTGALDCGDEFGSSVACLDDFDGDGVTDLAVGAARDDDGGTDRGAVWLLLLNSDGTVKAHQKISATAGGFAGGLADDDRFGTSVTSLGDMDGDGITDLAVGAAHAADGGFRRGVVWLLFLNADGTVKAHQRLGASEGGLSHAPVDADSFGSSLTLLNDRDGGGRPELVVGGAGVDLGADPQSGAIWILGLADGRARVAFRNAGTNPASYVSAAPILGETFPGTVDLTLTGHGMAALIGFDASVEVVLPGGQTLLCLDFGGYGALIHSGFFPGPVAEITLPVPNEPLLIGFELSAQALHGFGVTPFALSNAQDLTIGVRE